MDDAIPSIGRDTSRRIRDIDNVPFIPDEIKRYMGKEGIVSSVELEKRELSTSMLAEPKYDLVEYTDKVFFTFGPVYEIVGISEDLLAMFSSMMRQDYNHLGVESFVLNAKIFPKLKSLWSRTVQAIPEALAQDLVDWALSQEFVRRATGEHWKIKAYKVTMRDPAKPEDTFDIYVFFPVDVSADRNLVVGDS